jgi:L-alanine-DL-glutamate epimerase-like enolase superfamily enzyme
MGLLDDAFINLPKIANGLITAPEAPGHGLEFKPEVRKDFVLR